MCKYELYKSILDNVGHRCAKQNKFDIIDINDINDYINTTIKSGDHYGKYDHS